MQIGKDVALQEKPAKVLEMGIYVSAWLSWIRGLIIRCAAGGWHQSKSLVAIVLACPEKETAVWHR